MKTLKVVSRIATFSAIVSFIFLIFSAVISYLTVQMLYPGAPIEFFVYNIISTILPYLLSGVITLIIAVMSKGAADSSPEPEEALPPAPVKMAQAEDKEENA